MAFKRDGLAGRGQGWAASAGGLSLWGLEEVWVEMALRLQELVEK
jgi:hypothetical protein